MEYNDHLIPYFKHLCEVASSAKMRLDGYLEYQAYRGMLDLNSDKVRDLNNTAKETERVRMNFLRNYHEMMVNAEEQGRFY